MLLINTYQNSKTGEFVAEFPSNGHTDSLPLYENPSKGTLDDLALAVTRDFRFENLMEEVRGDARLSAFQYGTNIPLKTVLSVQDGAPKVLLDSGSERVPLTASQLVQLHEKTLEYLIR